MLVVALTLALSASSGVSVARAGLGSYPSTLYLSGTSSTLLGAGSWELSGSVMGATKTSKNRIAIGATGFQDFQPGFTTAVNAPVPTASASTTPNNKGWIVDTAGAVQFAAGTWNFTTSMIAGAMSGAPPPSATLAVGMWKVTVSGGVVSTSTLLVDPNCTAAPCGSGAAPGDVDPSVTPAANFLNVGGTGVTVALPVSLSSFSLADGEHLYVQYWRHEWAAYMSGGATNRLATMNANDGIGTITHPAATALPNAPALGAVAARVNATPTLSATYSNPDGDTGTLSFEVCSDNTCSSPPLWTGSSASGLADGATGTWTPPVTLGDGTHDGTYFWFAQATDSASNVSNWSSAGSFVVDTVPPSAPTFGAPANAARVNSSTLNATFVDADSTDSGTVDFQLCSNASCASVVGATTSAVVAPGGAVSWTPAVADGTYYWRLRAKDVAGNQTGWTAAQTFVLDTNSPATPTPSGPPNNTYLGAMPTLGGNFSSGDAGDSGTINVQLCSDSSCASVVASGSSASGILNGGSGTWTPGVADGVYFWRVQAQDAASNKSAWSATSAFTLDRQAPTVPTVGAIAARVNSTPNISATYTDPPFADVGSLTFDLCLNVGCSSILGSSFQNGIASGGNANWTPSSLPDGTYYWRVTATDSANNSSSATGSFVVDTVAPGKPTLTSPAAAARTNTPLLAATFVDSDATDTGTVTFQVCSDAACATVLSNHTSAVVSGGTALTWGAGPLADGTYYWRAFGKDVAGNVGAWTSIRSFVLDTNPPTVPVLGSVASHVSVSPQLSGSFVTADAGDSGKVLFQICSDSACTGVVASGSSASGLTSGANGTWTSIGLAPGSYFWRAAAQDIAGNQSAWSATGQFAFDTTPPSVPAPNGPADGSRVDQPPTLGATYVDPSAGPGDTGSVTFQLCPTSTCAVPLLTKTTGSLTPGTWASWLPGIGDGTYYWRVASQDAAGNPSAWSAVSSFIVDSTPPDVPVLAATVHAGVTPALSARVNEPSDPADQARIFVQICTDATCATVLVSGYSDPVAVGSLASWLAPSLADGTYAWRALAEDIVGNRSAWSAAATLIVDTVPPAAATPSSPSDSATQNKLRLSGAFPGSDPGDRGTLEFQLCSDAACDTVLADGSSATVAAGASATWTPGQILDDGSYFWRVRAVDLAGNASAWSTPRSLVLDQTPPGRPQDFHADISGDTLTLSWRPPADLRAVRGYSLLVNGKRIRIVKSTSRSVKIRLLRNDHRRFTLASFDAAGNVSASTPALPASGPRQAHSENPAAEVHRVRALPLPAARRGPHGAQGAVRRVP